MRYIWIVIGVVVALMNWVIQGRIGLSLWDEGFLWYGVQRIHVGEVPIRDFYAYDIGRYYVLAGLQKIWGNDGIVALRFGLACLQGIMLGAVGMILRHHRVHAGLIGVGLLLMVLWSYPHYRIPDAVVIVVAVVVLSWIGRLPTHSPYFFWLGVLYALTVLLLGDVRKHISFFVIAVLLYGWILALPTRQWWYWLIQSREVILGVIVGVLPLVGYALALPNFANAYWRNYIEVVLTRATPNIPLPFPRPWMMIWDGSWTSLREIIVGWVFIGYLVIVLTWLLRVCWHAYRGKTSNQLVMAGVVFAVPSISYVVSRPDVAHLTQGVMPFLLACVAWVGVSKDVQWRRSTIVMTLIVVSVIVLMPLQPIWQCKSADVCRSTNVLYDEIVIPTEVADQVQLIHHIHEDFVDEDGLIYIAPFLPGGYALLAQKAPVWEIYAIWPRDEQFEADEIALIGRHDVHAVLLQRNGMDGRDELSFRNTHPVTYKYLRDTYQTVPVYRDNLPGYIIMQRQAP